MNSMKNLRKKFYQYYINSWQTEEEGTLHTHFMRPVLLIPSPGIMRKENYKPISLMNIEAKALIKYYQ